MSTPEDRLAALGISLPSPAAPVANYVPFVRSGNLLFVSGQLPIGPDGAIDPAAVGKLGGGLSVEQGQAAAKLCAINVLAQAKAALGSLDRIVRCVRVTGFVAASPGFASIPAVVNGASDLFVAALNDRGRHARSAVGVAQLPLDAAVELEVTLEVT
jgi:enamine deaminase RidA (YjgF/YER057c/UK114 family)